MQKQERGLKKVGTMKEAVPQWLEARTKQGIYGTAEAVPLSETRFFSSL